MTNKPIDLDDPENADWIRQVRDARLSREKQIETLKGDIARLFACRHSPKKLLVAHYQEIREKIEDLRAVSKPMRMSDRSFAIELDDCDDCHLCVFLHQEAIRARVIETKALDLLQQIDCCSCPPGTSGHKVWCLRLKVNELLREAGR